MPPRGLPGNANLEQLRNGAKSFQRAVRSGDPGAAEVVREFHPRLSDARPTDLQGFTRTDAQLVVARQFGFASWPKLKAHVDSFEEAAQLRDAAKAKDDKLTNEILQRIHLKVRALRPES